MNNELPSHSKLLFMYTLEVFTVFMFFQIVFVTPVIAQGIGYAPWVGVTLNGINCTGREQGFGPYDYTQRARYSDALHLVEKVHFVREVKLLIPSKEGGIPRLGDLAYTLGAWPNHHEALYSAVRVEKNRHSYGLSRQVRNFPPAECWLQRAANYSPKDGVVYMLFGILLQQSDKPEKALEQYKVAERLNLPNGELAYNIGLVLFELERYTESAEYAKKVYDQGFPLPGLKDKLSRVGHWQEATLD